MAAEALKLITGVGRPLLGQVAVVDALQGGVRLLSLGASAPHRASVITAAQLSAALAEGASITLVDVRDPEEGEALPGAIRLPMEAIEDGASPSSADAEYVVVYCASGVRSQWAADLLVTRGLVGTRSLAGGIAAWATYHGLPTAP